MTMRTDEAMAGLLKLCEAATPGPWRHGPASTEVQHDFVTSGGTRTPCVLLTVTHENAAHDAAFIAAARTAVPDLLARLATVEGELERQRARADNAEREWCGTLNDLREANTRLATRAAELAATTRELERYRHGEALPEDSICPDSVALHEARAEVARLREVVDAACAVVAADSYKHPMLSREDAVKAGVMALHDAVAAYRALAAPSAPPPLPGTEETRPRCLDLDEADEALTRLRAMLDGVLPLFRGGLPGGTVLTVSEERDICTLANVLLDRVERAEGQLADLNDEGHPAWQSVNEHRAQVIAENMTLRAEIDRLARAVEEARVSMRALDGALDSTEERLGETRAERDRYRAEAERLEVRLRHAEADAEQAVCTTQHERDEARREALTLAADLGRMRAALVRETREADCRAICTYCREHDPTTGAVRHPGVNPVPHFDQWRGWCHALRDGWSGGSPLCVAHEIRILPDALTPAPPPLAVHKPTPK